MSDPPAATDRTSASLLARLGADPSDGASWDEFVRRYGRQVLGWCRNWRLEDADAEDIAQDVLLRVARQMRTFRYDAALADDLDRFLAGKPTLARPARDCLARAERGIETPLWAARPDAAEVRGLCREAAEVVAAAERWRAGVTPPSPHVPAPASP